jgi:hypothetical protein
MKPKRLTIIATILIVFTVGNGYGSAESLSTQALSQIKEFIQFYREDPKVLSIYRIIEDLCREEDGQTDTILEMFQATRMENPNGALQIEAIQENFLKLTTNDLDYIQDIFLYQIKTGKRFDLNFFHNLSVRSALNAIRLQYRDPGNIPEYSPAEKKYREVTKGYHFFGPKACFGCKIRSQ